MVGGVARGGDRRVPGARGLGDDWPLSWAPPCRTRPMAFASAIAFLIFAVWAWREGRAPDDDDRLDRSRTPVRASRCGVVVRARRDERQDDVGNGDPGQRSRLGRRVDRLDLGHGLGRRPGHRCGDAAASAAARSSCCTFWPACCSCCLACGCCWTARWVGGRWLSRVTATVALTAATVAAAQTLRRRRDEASTTGRSPRIARCPERKSLLRGPAAALGRPQAGHLRRSLSCPRARLGADHASQTAKEIPVELEVVQLVAVPPPDTGGPMLSPITDMATAMGTSMPPIFFG